MGLGGPGQTPVHLPAAPASASHGKVLRQPGRREKAFPTQGPAPPHQGPTVRSHLWPYLHFAVGDIEAEGGGKWSRSKASQSTAEKRRGKPGLLPAPTNPPSPTWGHPRPLTQDLAKVLLLLGCPPPTVPEVVGPLVLAPRALSFARHVTDPCVVPS